MILVTGATGQLGEAILKCVTPRTVPLTRDRLDLRDTAIIPDVLSALRPDVLINCAAYTAVEHAEEDEETARVINAAAVEAMARWCRLNGSRFVTYSTDYVFDGAQANPYVESDQAAPLNAYGRTKREGEQRAMLANPYALVIRTSWLLSGAPNSFTSKVLSRAGSGPIDVVVDQTGSPTMVDDLASRTLELLGLPVHGLLHVVNSGQANWFELARTIFRLAGLEEDLVRPITSAALEMKAKRPSYSVLGSERRESSQTPQLLPWQQSLEKLLDSVGWLADE